MLIAIIVIAILTWAYLVYLLVRLHRLINRAHKEMDMRKEPWDDDPMMKLLRSKATFHGQNYAEPAPEPESTKEAIQKEFGPRPEENQKMYDRQMDAEASGWEPGFHLTDACMIVIRPYVPPYNGGVH